MLDLSNAQHFTAIEAMVDVLCTKTQNQDRGFFRVVSAYFLAKMAATMGAKIVTKDRGEIPVNVYTTALATSGFGKGHSVHILEQEFLSKFRKRFMSDTFPTLSEQNLWKMASERAAQNSTEEENEKQGLDKEFRAAGALPFTFDGATPAAVKQLRQKLLMATCGAINLQIDEIGSNLMQSTDVLTLFLELYDQGMVKQKLTKNTAENTRGEELDGKTPTNALLFGTPSKLLDGGQTEDQFFTFLETGYARRCLFAWGDQERSSETLTPAEIYYQLTQPQNEQDIEDWSDHFESLADPANYGWTMYVDDQVGIELLTYKIDCERIADAMPEHEEIRKAEMKHRYFKALKLAGTFAFIEEVGDITMEHLHSAILLVEESGKAFDRLMNREKAYVKLAKYIAANAGTELTHADLHEQLPFYKASNSARQEMMTLAAAWGYKNHIIIRKTFAEGIEFFSGDTLEETDLDALKVTYSDHMAYNYVTDEAPFDQLHNLTQMPGYHWTNHAFNNGHRCEEQAIPGFNLVVIDCDGEVPLETVHDLMSEYKFMTYTTKRHGVDDLDRFRLILPINYNLELDADDYKQFMNNILEWLPFNSDEGANQRSKKWLTHDGDYHYNTDGILLDALQFVPHTSRNEHYLQTVTELQSLDNLERWFAQRIASGNRNNQLIRYALTLTDSGMSFSEVERRLFEFNAKLSNGLSVDEIRNTILVTVAKKLQNAA